MCAMKCAFARGRGTGSPNEPPKSLEVSGQVETCDGLACFAQDGLCVDVRGELLNRLPHDRLSTSTRVRERVVTLYFTRTHLPNSIDSSTTTGKIRSLTFSSISAQPTVGPASSSGPVGSSTASSMPEEPSRSLNTR